MKLYDIHSHWGNEEYYPLRTKAQQARQVDVWKTECRFWSKPEMAEYFRKNNAQVMLDLSFTRELTIEQVRVVHDDMIAFQRANPDVVLGNWLQVAPQTGKAGIDELERCRKAGAGVNGLAVSAMGNRMLITDPIFDQFYDYALSVNMPVMFFIGYTGVGAGAPGGDGIVLELNHPRYVDQIAARYPKLQIIAGRSAWPWENDMIATLLHKANVWTELHGVSPKRLPDAMKQEIRGRLKNKVMFALDFPMLRYEKIVADWHQEGYSEDVLERVFYKNAEAFLARVKGA